MASLYSVQLWLTAVDTGSPVYIGPPPDGFLWVIRDLLATNNSGGPDTLYVNDLDSGINILAIFDPGEDTSYHYEGRIVVPAGGGIVLTALSGYWTSEASGYQLTLP